MDREGVSRTQTVLGVGSIFVEAGLGVLANAVTGWNILVLLAFGVLTLVLAVFTYLRIRGVATTGADSAVRRFLAGRWSPALMLFALTWCAAVVLYLSTANHPATDKDPLSGCPFAAGGAGVVPARPQASGDLTFCPVLVNGGSAITGAFALAGRVIAPVGERNAMILAVLPDPRTCDALGNRPKGGTFVTKVDLRSPDGSWSIFNSVEGYPEGVTIGKEYQYITAPPATIELMRRDQEIWLKEHPGQFHYPGIYPLPDDARILARFPVAPGTYSGNTVACKD